MIRTKVPTYFFGVVIAIVSLFILQLTLIEFKENTSYPSNSSKGEIDVSNINFNGSSLIGLVGEYEFYWNQLLTPKDFKDSTKKDLTGYIHLPGLWNGYVVNGKELPANGYATFRIRIKVPDEDLYSIKIQEFDCAYRLWVNGHYTECGKVGTNKSEEKPSWRRYQAIVYTYNKQIDLILQVSNFNHRKGGPEDLMLLGKADSVTSYKNKQLAITYFLIGLFFIMFIYNYGLYIYRRKEKSYLYFSLICLLIMLRESTTGEKVIYDILPNINWQIMIRIEYLSYTIVIPIFYMFVRVLDPNYFSRFFERLLNLLSAIVVLIILFTPVRIFSYTPLFYQAVVALAAILTLAGLIKAVINRRDDSLFMLFGYSVLFAICINDILYYNKLLNTTFLMPFGLFIIVFVNAFTLSKRFSNSFTTIEALTHELSEHNIELENKILERTKEVLNQKQEIENQALALQETNRKILELGRFKDNLTNMIVHDLKNPVNTIMNISIMDDIPQKDNIIHEAGREMNNLVMNILDVFKYENTSMVLNKELVNVKELIEGAITDVSFLGKLRNVVFEYDIIEDLEVNLDRKIMHRVVVNLLTNAIKFSPLRSKIEIYTQIVSNDFIKISVKDNGPGVSPARQKIIFDRYQSESQQDNLLLSTGLGLNFCKLAIDAHGGDINVESVEMKGATFNVFLPLSESISIDFQELRREVKKQSVEEEFLDKNDIEAILPYIEELKGYEVYQVSDIFRVLNRLSKNDNPKLQKWLMMVTDSVLLCQQSKYSELLSLTKNE